MVVEMDMTNEFYVSHTHEELLKVRINGEGLSCNFNAFTIGQINGWF